MRKQLEKIALMYDGSTTPTGLGGVARNAWNAAATGVTNAMDTAATGVTNAMGTAASGAAAAGTGVKNAWDASAPFRSRVSNAMFPPPAPAIPRMATISNSPANTPSWRAQQNQAGRDFAAASRAGETSGNITGSAMGSIGYLAAKAMGGDNYTAANSAQAGKLIAGMAKPYAGVTNPGQASIMQNKSYTPTGQAMPSYNNAFASVGAAPPIYR